MRRNGSCVSGGSVGIDWRCSRSAGGQSANVMSLPMQCGTSSRKPSTPRSSQKRATPSMGSTTSGLDQFRWGCSGRWGVRGLESEAIDAAVEPEAGDAEHGVDDLGVRPVQVGLLGKVVVEVPLLGG